MEIEIIPVLLPNENNRLIRFLTSENWPFHVNFHLDSVKAERMIQQHFFDGSDSECHWIRNQSEQDIGLLRIYELDDIEDGFPLFDIRLHTRFRGQGIGKIAVEWLSKYLFEKYHSLDRIMGATRADNVPMRKTFRACYFAKESHARKDWPTASGKLLDTVKYCLLKEDWEQKKVSPVNWNDEN